MKSRCRVSALLLVFLSASPCISAAAESSSLTFIGDRTVIADNTAIADNDGTIDGLPGIVVVSSTPLAGSEVNRDQVPESTRILEAGDINRTGIPSLTGAILDNVPSASVSDTEGNAFQPDILFR